MSATTVVGNVDPVVVINITPERVAAFLALMEMYGAGKGLRNIETEIYPGGSYVSDTIVFRQNFVTAQLMTSLCIIAPGSVLVTLSQNGLIYPPLDLTKISAAQIFPGVNDFAFVPNPSTVKVPPPVLTNFIGPELDPGSGRFAALPSPLDHFADGSILQINGKSYRKTFRPSIFSPAGIPEWDEVTVVG